MICYWFYNYLIVINYECIHLNYSFICTCVHLDSEGESSERNSVNSEEVVGKFSKLDFFLSLFIN